MNKTQYFLGDSPQYINWDYIGTPLTGGFYYENLKRGMYNKAQGEENGQRGMTHIKCLGNYLASRGIMCRVSSHHGTHILNIYKDWVFVCYLECLCDHEYSAYNENPIKIRKIRNFLQKHFANVRLYNSVVLVNMSKEEIKIGNNGNHSYNFNGFY